MRERSAPYTANFEIFIFNGGIFLSDTTFKRSANGRKNAKRRYPANTKVDLEQVPGLVFHADEAEKQNKQNKQPKQNKPSSASPKQRGRSKEQNKLQQTIRQAKQPSPTAAAQKPKKDPSNKQTKANERDTKPLRIVPLGGLNEIGKNMTVFEYGDDAFIVDCGIAFPDNEMLGIDLVIPDYTYLTKIADRVRGVVLTHGHEDHIGGLPFFLQKLNVPVYGTKLTVGLVEGKLAEYGLLERAKLHVVKPGDRIPLGAFNVEIIHSNHSIADAVMLAIRCPAGVIVHTGDFKIDCTPILDEMIDLGRLGQIGKEGVLLLMSDSTNAERLGFTPSERIVGASFNNLFLRAENKRIIIATFSSNIQRVQQIFDCAQKYNRKVAISGRSMLNVITKAIELGYLTAPDGLIIDLETVNHYSKEQVVVITTGSQGEPMSALYRMAFSDHRMVVVGPDDCIIISANPIPGNEISVGRVVNELMKLGATVLYESMYDVHVSGHACQEEQKIILGLTKPAYFMPVHGEFKHLNRHAETAKSMGYTDKNIIIGDIGKVVEITKKGYKFNGTVPSGRVFIDGSGVGDVGSIVLRDRKHLGEDGVIAVVATITADEPRLILAGPDIVSRGFVYVRESEELIEGARRIAQKAIEDCLDDRRMDWNSLKNTVRDELSDYIFSKTKRRPMIMPIIMEA